MAQPKEGPAQLKPCAARLKRVFRCNQLEVLGTDTESLRDGAERTLIPTRHFWLTYKARRASAKEARGGYLLNLELYQEKTPLVDTVAMIAPQSPLCFRGPAHPRGQIIVVLQVLPLSSCVATSVVVAPLSKPTAAANRWRSALY